MLVILASDVLTNERFAIHLLFDVLKLFIIICLKLIKPYFSHLNSESVSISLFIISVRIEVYL